MYEICIVGGGPAGMATGLYSARAGRKTLLLESAGWGGQLNLTEKIENIPGLEPLRQVITAMADGAVAAEAAGAQKDPPTGW